MAVILRHCGRMDRSSNEGSRVIFSRDCCNLAAKRSLSSSVVGYLFSKQNSAGREESRVERRYALALIHPNCSSKFNFAFGDSENNLRPIISSRNGCRRPIWRGTARSLNHRFPGQLFARLSKYLLIRYRCNIVLPLSLSLVRRNSLLIHVTSRCCNYLDELNSSFQLCPVCGRNLGQRFFSNEPHRPPWFENYTNASYTYEI